MLLQPKTSVTEIQDIGEENYQPNGIDLEIDEVYRINETAFHLSKTGYKVEATTTYVKEDNSGVFTLSKGIYRIKYKQKICIPLNEAGIVVPRSSLIRNGVKVFSALYDSGYGFGENVRPGEMWGLLEVSIGTFVVDRGTRVAQYVSFKSEPSEGYDGQYQVKEEIKVDKIEDKKFKRIKPNLPDTSRQLYWLQPAIIDDGEIY